MQRFIVERSIFASRNAAGTGTSLPAAMSHLTLYIQMKALLPAFCRPLGYFVIALALFLPFILLMTGWVTDANFIFYRECSKLLMMMGALMIIFALSKHEDGETLRIRNTSVRNAMFITVLFVFGNMVYRIWKGDTASVDSSSFLIFLIINVLCLEYGLKKARIDRLFKGNRQ